MGRDQVDQPVRLVCPRQKPREGAARVARCTYRRAASGSVHNRECPGHLRVHGPCSHRGGGQVRRTCDRRHAVGRPHAKSIPDGLARLRCPQPAGFRRVRGVERTWQPAGTSRATHRNPAPIPPDSVVQPAGFRPRTIQGPSIEPTTNHGGGCLLPTRHRPPAGSPQRHAGPDGVDRA